MQYPLTILTLLSCTSSKTKSTEILSCSNHKSSCSLHKHEPCHSLMRLFRYSILQSLQEQTIVSCASSDLKPNEIPSHGIHKHEPLSNANNVPHRTPYSLKSTEIFSSRNQKHDPFSNFSHVLHQILKLLKSPHASCSIHKLSCSLSYVSSDTKSTKIPSCSIHKNEPVFSHINLTMQNPQK